MHVTEMQLFSAAREPHGYAGYLLTPVPVLCEASFLQKLEISSECDHHAGIFTGGSAEGALAYMTLVQRISTVLSSASPLQEQEAPQSGTRSAF